MEFLRKLLESTKMDPSKITKGDVNTYARHVKTNLAGKKVTKSAVSSIVHDLIEDDPKFGSNPGIASQLIAQVFAKLSESVELNSSTRKRKLEALRDKEFKGTLTKEERKELEVLEDADKELQMHESATQLDEISKELVDRYKEKAKGNAEGHADSAVRHGNKGAKNFEDAAEHADAGDSEVSKAHITIGVHHKEKAWEHRTKLDKRLKGLEMADKRTKSVSEGAIATAPELDKLESEFNALKAKMSAGKRAAFGAFRRRYHAHNAKGMKQQAKDNLHDMWTVLADHKEMMNESTATSDSLAKAKAKAQKISQEEGVIQHVREDDDGSYYVSDWYNHEDTVATYNNGKLREGYEPEDDDEDADVKIAASEAKKRGIKMLSTKAEKALANKLSKQDKDDETKSVKKVKMDESAMDVDNLTTKEIEQKLLAATKAHYKDESGFVVRMDKDMMHCEIPGKDRCYSTVCMNTGKVKMLGEGWDDNDDDEDADVKIAAAEAKKRGIKMLSTKAEKALANKLSKQDKDDETKSVKKVKTDESVEVTKRSFKSYLTNK